MPQLAYLFERFPSFGQHFIYREVAELTLQGVDAQLFSIRRPQDEPAEDWDPEIVRRVHYLPEEKELVAKVDGAMRRGQLPASAGNAIVAWARQTDFLRLYQAAYVGLRLRESGVRRVHAHFAGMAARTAYWLREFFGTDYSFTAHANDIFAPRDFAVNLGRLVESADAVVSVSDFAVRALQQRFAAAAQKFHRVYNGIDVSAFPQASFDEPVAKILSVGRLIEKKGFADLIDACALLTQRGNRFTAEIVGEGPLAQELRDRIVAQQLGDYIQLAGPLPQRAIGERLAAATLFVLPCRTEPGGGMDNLPTVIMEAMAASLPVISTFVAGVPEMVEHQSSGLLVQERDINALADSIAHLLDHRDDARQFGGRGREIAEEKFSIERNVAQLRRILLGQSL